MNVVKTLIGFADFFFRKKSKILMHLGINALFEFHSKPSAGSDVNSTLQIRLCKGRKKRERFLVLKMLFTLDFHCSSFLKLCS